MITSSPSERNCFKPCGRRWGTQMTVLPMSPSECWGSLEEEIDECWKNPRRLILRYNKYIIFCIFFSFSNTIRKIICFSTSHWKSSIHVLCRSVSSALADRFFVEELDFLLLQPVPSLFTICWFASEPQQFVGQYFRSSIQILLTDS